MNNFGVIFTEAHKGRRYERRAWKAVSFAMGMNRIADFNHDYSYKGNNNTSSASLIFEADANYTMANATPNTAVPGTPAYMCYQSYITTTSHLHLYNYGTICRRHTAGQCGAGTRGN